jgi:hypothetical protein
MSNVQVYHPNGKYYQFIITDALKNLRSTSLWIYSYGS